MPKPTGTIERELLSLSGACGRSYEIAMILASHLDATNARLDEMKDHDDRLATVEREIATIHQGLNNIARRY